MDEEETEEVIKKEDSSFFDVLKDVLGSKIRIKSYGKPKEPKARLRSIERLKIPKVGKFYKKIPEIMSFKRLKRNRKR